MNELETTIAVQKIIVPDHVLDELLCDNCHKYLSVKPIRMGCHKILCGRCINEENSEYVNSKYEIFAEYALFKCINHFDGCNILLSYDEVNEHEKHCKSENFRCIWCPELSEVPIYLLPYHVKNRHKNIFLKKNYFTVELVHLQRNVFFYKTDNYLLFIEQSFNSNNKCISVQFTNVSTHNVKFSSRIHLKYSIKLQGDGDILCELKTWSQIFDIDGNNTYKGDIVLSTAKDNQLVAVHFEMEITTAPQFVLMDVKLNSTNITLDFLLKREIKLQFNHSEGDICKWSRDLSLHNMVLYGSDYALAINPCNRELIVIIKRESYTICFHCVFCKYVKDIKDNFIHKIGSKVHMFCSSCARLFNNFIELVPIWTILYFKYIGCLKISCNQRCPPNCSQKHHKKINTNEILINKSCCMKNCTYIATNVLSFIDHFKDFHNSILHYMRSDDMKIIGYYDSHKFYILQDDLIIEISVELVSPLTLESSQRYWLSAKICDKNKTNLNLLMHIFSCLDYETNYVGTYFKNAIKVELAKGYSFGIYCFTL